MSDKEGCEMFIIDLAGGLLRMDENEEPMNAENTPCKYFVRLDEHNATVARLEDRIAGLETDLLIKTGMLAGTTQASKEALAAWMSAIKETAP